MTNESRPSNSPSDKQMNAELELLHSILDPNPCYPWNPYTPEGEDYLAALEAQWDESGTTDAISAGWQALSTQLDSLWPTQPVDRIAALVKVLSQQFSAAIPEDVLGSLARQAITLVNSGRPLMEQLVQSVQCVVTGWDTEDLEVLARPLAFSLRDGRGDILSLYVRSSHPVDWETLSELEKARLSLAIASVALRQAQELE
ncbi:MAG TPA: hypothetical protein V6D07_09610 [Trichocoleus sp.]